MFLQEANGTKNERSTDAGPASRVLHPPDSDDRLHHQDGVCR
jgi:hypothetical protein